MSLQAVGESVELEAMKNAPPDPAVANAKRNRTRDLVFHNLVRSLAVLTLLTLLAIIVSLCVSSWPITAPSVQ